MKPVHILSYLLIAVTFLLFQSSSTSAQSFLSDVRSISASQMTVQKEPGIASVETEQTRSTGKESKNENQLTRNDPPATDLLPRNGSTQQQGSHDIVGRIEADIIQNSENSTVGEFTARELLNQASDLVMYGEYGQALVPLEKISSFEEEGLSEAERFEAMELHRFLFIKIYFFLGSYDKVIELASDYFGSFSNGKHYYRTYYYLTASLHYEKKPLQFVSLVTEEFFSNLSSRQSHHLRRFLIEDAIAKGQCLTAYHFMLDVDGILIPGFERQVSEVIDKVAELDDIDSILNENPVNFVRSHAYLRKVQLLIRDGDYVQAKDFLTVIINSSNIDSATIAELLDFQNFINIALNTDPYKIGVILPFSHPRFGILARQALDGLELALQARFSGDHRIELIIKDSALIPDSGTDGNPRFLTAKERVSLVREQVRELVEEDRVIAILGPLAKNTSLAAGEMAEIYKVPVISFSITEGLGEKIPSLFRFQRSKIAEAENLARYALDYLQATRFVLFYLNDSMGKGYEVMQAFYKTVIENGGQIVGISPIQYGQVDFRENYQSFTGGFRKFTSLEELNDDETENEPIVDFDLMYVPVPLNTLKIILNFNRSFNAEDVWVLSGSEINVKENQLLDHTRQLRFIDAFPIGSSSTYLQPFFEDHWRSYNFRPDYQSPTSYTIYAYEALETISKLLNNPRFHNRESLRNAIQNLDGFPVLTGNVHCDEAGELVKDLNILRIRSKNTVAVF